MTLRSRSWTWNFYVKFWTAHFPTIWWIWFIFGNDSYMSKVLFSHTAPFPTQYPQPTVSAYGLKAPVQVSSAVWWQLLFLLKFYIMVILYFRNQGYRNQQLSVKHITVTGCTQRKLSETALPLSSEDTEANVFVQNSTLAIQTLQSSIDKSLIFYKNTFYGVLDLLEKKCKSYMAPDSWKMCLYNIDPRI